MRIPELDGLRAIAILLVLGCHYELVARQFGGILGFGWLGVDVFFALSGYLITTVLLGLRNRPGALRVFYQRRALRILPPYAVALGIVCLLAGALGERTLFTPKAAISNLLFLQSFQRIPEMLHQLFRGSHGLTVTSPKIEAYGIAGTVESSVAVFWSLSVEEYFYVLWAPVVLFCSRSCAALAAVGVCAAEFAVRRYGYIGEQTYFSGPHRFDALMYGALVALALSIFKNDRRLPSIMIRAAATAFSAIVFVCLWMGPFLGHEIRESGVFMVFGMSALAIGMAATVGILVLSTGHRAWAPLRCAPIRFAGRISYMLYLIHAPIYLLLRSVYGTTWTVTALSFGIAVAFCALSWKYMEEPLLRRRDQARFPSLKPFNIARTVGA